MPTISGIRRRGYTPEAIRLFCERVGISKADNNIDMSVLEDCAREVCSWIPFVGLSYQQGIHEFFRSSTATLIPLLIRCVLSSSTVVCSHESVWYYFSGVLLLGSSDVLLLGSSDASSYCPEYLDVYMRMCRSWRTPVRELLQCLTPSSSPSPIGKKARLKCLKQTHIRRGVLK